MAMTREQVEAIAQQFHEAYERLAPAFSYTTRTESCKPWADVPEQNRNLMIAVCAEVMTRHDTTLHTQLEAMRAVLDEITLRRCDAEAQLTAALARVEDLQKVNQGHLASKDYRTKRLDQVITERDILRQRVGELEEGLKRIIKTADANYDLPFRTLAVKIAKEATLPPQGLHTKGIAPMMKDELDIDALVNRFLAWPLPDSVCSDLCATKQGYPHRSGTTLLTAVEAKAMISYLLDLPPGAGKETP